MLSGISLFYLVVYFFYLYKYSCKIQTKKFIRAYPKEDPKKPENFLRIHLIDSIFRQEYICNFVYHLIFQILAHIIAPELNLLHMLLIINIAKTTRLILDSLKRYVNLIFATAVFTLFLFYIYSILIKEYYPKELRKMFKQKFCSMGILNCISEVSTYSFISLLNFVFFMIMNLII